jgi:hypothetical protein
MGREMVNGARMGEQTLAADPILKRRSVTSMPLMDSHAERKVAIVTGASTGIEQLVRCST